MLLAFGLSLGAGAALNLAVGRFGDRFGRRRTMVGFGGLMAVTGAVVALAPSFPVALVGLALGALSPSGTEVGPALSLDQSIVADVSAPDRRARSFASYNLIGTLAAAAGALASVPFTLIGGEGALRLVFVAYAGLGVVSAAIATRLPSEVEVAENEPVAPLTEASRSRVLRMAALFGVDSFAGGLILQSYVSLWFVTVYPSSASYVGAVFFGAGVLSALSFVLAARLAERFGLLETAVFTHLPSSVLLALVPLAPNLAGAMALYLGRMAISQMDVPTRQAYLAGIVGPRERTAANSYTNTSRNVGQAGGPFGGATAVAWAGLAAPFFACSALKIAYDLALFAAFRRVRPAGPEPTPTGRAAT